METSSAPQVSQFEEFINEKYKDEITRIAQLFPEKRSVEIDYQELDKYDIKLADDVIEKPYQTIRAARDAIIQMGLLSGTGEEFKPHVRFYNLPPENKVLLRNLSSQHINKFISVDGVVTKVTEVKPKIVEAVFECKNCLRRISVKQEEQSEKLTEPTVCVCGGKSFELILEESKFIDTQKAEIQEPLEVLRGGEQVKTITLWLEDDLTNRLVPGDKIEVIGVLRLEAPKRKGSIFNKFIDVNNFVKKEKEFEEIELSAEDMQKIKQLSQDPDVYKKIVKSIAPSIYGHDEIKEAIALQLFGGTPGKMTPDGMRIRPDMHILLIGDPGTAKSRLLQYVNSLAPKGIYVSGKSSSAAGLTATAEKEEFGEGTWVLKAGALVLAAGGMAMIDEFDKMSPEDRAAMHEAMETQEIHVAKAGIITTFKANTAILAAANPKYGRFDPNTAPAEQFDIPPTIISRFDLIFPVRDVLDKKRDAEMAEYILKTHRYAAQSVKGEESEEKVAPALEPEFLQKYIAYSRKHVMPVLSQEAIEKIRDFYVNLRSIGENQGSIPITARQLEAIVRLAEASAKVRLSETVEIEDAERAIRLITFCLKKIGIDPETGKYDIDIIAIGQPKSKSDKIRSIYNLIKRLEKEYDEVNHEMLVEEAEKIRIDAEELQEILHNLKKRGDIYSPKHDVYRTTEMK
ncbi:AAA family ATPase [Candidatus Micrarchaeota archaeon]|nr:MAG: AAA family ATPase [Candidatus Micrarchaeota archaeon]